MNLDFFFSRPFLALVCFVRRKPAIALGILALLFVIGTFEFWVTAALGVVFGKSLPTKVAALADWALKFKWILALCLLPFAPLLGWFFLAWFIVGRMKEAKAKGASATISTGGRSMSEAEFDDAQRKLDESPSATGGQAPTGAAAPQGMFFGLPMALEFWNNSFSLNQ